MGMNPMAAMLGGLGGMVKRSTLKTNTADGGRSRRRNTDFTVGGRRDPVPVDLFSDTFTPVKSHITGNSVAIGTSGSVKDAVSQKGILTKFDCSVFQWKQISRNCQHSVMLIHSRCSSELARKAREVAIAVSRRKGVWH